MALQIKRTGSVDHGLYIKALVCGEPGSGKTKTGATWPNPLYANAEGGLLSIREQDIPTQDITSSAVLLELKDALAGDSKSREKAIGVPVDTVVIDTLDEVARLMIKERLEQQNKDAMAIQDWGWLGESLRNMVRAYRNLPINVIFNCHLKSVEDAESGSQFLKPAIQGAMGDEIAGYVDIAVVLTARPRTQVVDGKNQREIVRIMQTFPDLKRPWVKDRSGKLPMEFRINFEDDYERLHKLIYGSTATAAPKVQETVVQPQETAVETEVEPPVEETPKQAEAPAEEKPKSKAKAKAAPKKTEAKEPEPKPDEPEPKAEEGTPEPPTEESAPAPEPEEATPEAEEVEPQAKESVPPTETAPKVAELPNCADCDKKIENRDQHDMTKIRFRRPLCRSCMSAERAKKKAS